MSGDFVEKIRRGLRKPPAYILERMLHELRGRVERHVAPHRVRRICAGTLARRAGFGSSARWWEALSRLPHAAQSRMSSGEAASVCPGDHARILDAAERALNRIVDLLGSGPVSLGADVDWHRDYKTVYRWPPAYFKDIEYNNLERPSDVKFPWELSRMQWMIPLGQAYALTGDERYATACRDLLDDWMRANPYGGSVNWSCTMEVALRIVSWSWFFHVFCDSAAWSDAQFRERFLVGLYLHGDFTARNLEKSDINGNHYTADAAGLVVAGLFFDGAAESNRWLEQGWNILTSELPLQVSADGVDHEASIPYHRLVLELFLLPALYRQRRGLPVPQPYRDRLVQMARFTAAYSRVGGEVPQWGDGDDGRVLPFGGQDLNDHRYLTGLVGRAFGCDDLLAAFSGPRSEILWLLGAPAAAALPDRAVSPAVQKSAAFRDGGFYVLRNEVDHVFVDCGPSGLGGRGGHGHNDLLSFEAVLDGVHLIGDCGSYVYTADYRERQAFRSTAYHNTPQIDGEEINRFMGWNYLWTLHDDAAHELRELSFSDDADRLVMSHTGYRRLTSPVTVIRSIRLDHAEHRLTIRDEFEGEREHDVRIPLHLAPGVDVLEQRAGEVVLRAGQQRFTLRWQSDARWELDVMPHRISRSYGVVVESSALIWKRTGPLSSLAMTVQPLAVAAATPRRQKAAT